MDLGRSFQNGRISDGYNFLSYDCVHEEEARAMLVRGS